MPLDPLAERLGDRDAARRADLERRVAIRERKTGADRRLATADLPPSTGTWAAGDRIYYSDPSPGGREGVVCTTGGTPGTWKAFGDIAT